MLIGQRDASGAVGLHDGFCARVARQLRDVCIVFRGKDHGLAGAAIGCGGLDDILRVGAMCGQQGLHVLGRDVGHIGQHNHGRRGRTARNPGPKGGRHGPLWRCDDPRGAIGDPSAPLCVTRMQDHGDVPTGRTTPPKLPQDQRRSVNEFKKFVGGLHPV